MIKKVNFSFIKIGCWNIHGAYYKVNGFDVNKLEDPLFLGTLKEHDILCLQETHCGLNDLMNSHIHEFHGIPHCRKISNNNRYFGGMLLLVRKTIRKGVKVVSTDNRDILGIRLLKSFFGLPEDLTIWFVYAPPLGTPYLIDRENVLNCLDKKLNNTNHSMVMGDLNGKTNTDLDYVPDLHDKHSPINDIEGYNRDSPSPRNNMDVKRVDKQGKKILEICQSHQLRILNGRTAGDRWGHPTRYPTCKRETPSLLDYTLCTKEYIKKIKTFHVQRLTDLSDHCCITCKMETVHTIEQETKTQTKSNTAKGYKYDSKLSGLFAQKLKDNARLAELKNKMERLGTPPSQDLVDNLAEEFGQSVLECATQTFPSRPPRTKKPLKQQKPAKWFNNQCSELKKCTKGH